MPDTVYDLSQGRLPLLISIPHLGTHIPPALQTRYTPEALALADTDWHLDRLYAFADAIGASVLRARISRYVIDLNRPPDGQSLYPGQTTTGLCPLETFRGEALYRPGQAPDGTETAARLAAYWQPYHQALAGELARLRTRHGQVLLWEAHSIASVLPRLFEGKLPDLNLGTHSGAACADTVLNGVVAALGKAPSELTHVVNGRFKGGYITRHYGQPSQGVHAIQLEKCQSLYMDEAPPFGYREDKSRTLAPLLQAMIEGGVQALAQVER